MEEMNNKAMEMILLAGDARYMMDQAIQLLIDNKNEEYNELMQQAKTKLVEAHRIQTNIIQQTVTIENFITPMLFIHAQDTLMVINSELISMNRFYKIVNHFKKGN